MVSRVFDAALSEPDDDASQSQLRQLIVDKDFKTLTSATAEQYLHAFCDPTVHHARRRWIGLVFTGMIGAASGNFDCLQISSQALQKLGSIVLSDTELEVIKVVAGLIMRQAIVHNIGYNSFWASDKVRNSAPNFPRDVDARWMPRFQDFLDALHSLALTASNNDTSIMYPISLNSPGEFEWAKSEQGLPVAIIQAESITVILPDRGLRDIHLLDVPINHICSARSQQTVLHDSQARVSIHEPWEVILTLRKDPWSYRLNTSPHLGTELVFMFGNSGDAWEWEGCVKEHQQSTGSSMGPSPPRGHSQMSSSSPIKCGNASPKNHNAKHQVTTQISQPGLKKDQSRFSGRNSKSHEEPESATLDHAVHPKPRPANLPRVRTVLGEIEKNDESVVVAEGTEERPLRIQPSRAANRTKKAEDRSQVREQSTSEAQSNEQSPISQVSQKGSTSKTKASGKGKLPKVSQSTKDRVVKRVPKPVVDFDVPKDSSGKTDKQHTQAASIAAKVKPNSQQQPNPSRNAGQSQKPGTKATQTRLKRKADDDDDFVPEKVRSKITTSASRKSGLRPIAGTNKRRKTLDKGSADGTVATSNEVQVSTRHNDDETTVSIPSGVSGKARNLREAQSHVPKNPTSSGRSTKASLINGLLDSHKTVKPAKPLSPTFKKPLPPVSSVQYPSTPTKVRTRPAESSTRAQTPVDMLTQSKSRSLSFFRSSPPLLHAADGSRVWTPHIPMHREILSSNSKPVPASPNAESTAISGHADREDVDVEKEKADFQTAKSDPFRQRRSNQKVSSFTRRLTGEGTDGSPIQSIDIPGSSDSALPILDAEATNELLPEAMPWGRKDQKAIAKQTLDMTVLRSESPLKPRLQQTAGREQDSRPLHQLGQSGALKILEASVRSEEHTAKEISGRSANKTLQDVDRGFTGIPMQAPVRSLAAETAVKHPSRDLQHITNESVVSAPQQFVEDTQLTGAAPGTPQTHLTMYGDDTLVNDHQYGLGTTGRVASSIYFPSSPPIGGSPSSHSSTSADSDLPPTDTPIPDSEAEELEWEASLNPHQRALHDLLIRTSKRVLRHVVDNETAVTDIADIFERDGEHVLRSLLERQHDDYEHVFRELDVEGKSLQHELQDVAKHLAKQRKRIRAMA